VGVRYEANVREHLGLLACGVPDLEYIESPWVEFQDASGRRWCQPDALLVDKLQRAVIIAEVKYQHTQDAWWQLVHLYRPVVAVLFPQYNPIAMLEIVHWHDPKVEWPERYDLTDSPLRIPHVNKVAVCIFNSRRGAFKTPDAVPDSRHYGGQGNGQDACVVGNQEGSQ
jgi:hypothetical protein